MAGVFKPEGITGREGTYKIWNYDLYDPAENLFNGSATAVYSGVYAGTSARKTTPDTYWYVAGHYLDIEFFSDVNIWDFGPPPSWTHIKGSLAVYKNKNGVKGEYVTDLLEHDSARFWKMIGYLQKGRYRIEFKSLFRISAEWYLEATSDREKSLIKIGNKYYALQDGKFIEVELTLENFEEYGLTDLSQLTASTNKVLLTMESQGIVETGKTYSKKVNPVNWDRLIKSMNVK